MKKESRALTATQRAYLSDEVREMLMLRDKLDHDTATRLEWAVREAEARGVAEGVAKGEARGRLAEKQETARRALALGLDRDLVLRALELPADTVLPCEEASSRVLSHDDDEGVP